MIMNTKDFWRANNALFPNLGGLHVELMGDDHSRHISILCISPSDQMMLFKLATLNNKVLSIFSIVNMLQRQYASTKYSLFFSTFPSLTCS